MHLGFQFLLLERALSTTWRLCGNKITDIIIFQFCFIQEPILWLFVSELHNHLILIERAVGKRSTNLKSFLKHVRWFLKKNNLIVLCFSKFHNSAFKTCTKTLIDEGYGLTISKWASYFFFKIEFRTSYLCSCSVIPLCIPTWMCDLL